MTPRPAVAFVGIAALAMLAAAGLFARSVIRYLDSPVAVSSTSGNRVFRVDGELAAYPPFELGLEPTLAGFSLVLFVAAVVVAAACWRSQPSSRILSSTAGRNADAHTR
jgi:hypothetical protein